MTEELLKNNLIFKFQAFAKSFYPAPDSIQRVSTIFDIALAA